MGIGPPELGLLGEDRGIFTLPLRLMIVVVYEQL